MKKNHILLLALLILLSFSNCSKKTIPSGSAGNTGNKGSTSTSVKPTTVKPIKTPTPKVIVVNDSSASKTFDGKLYYDLEGHRYWKNYKDGKYYLYNKSMNNNPDFKKPQ
jgi:hypothetical protein